MQKVKKALFTISIILMIVPIRSKAYTVYTGTLMDWELQRYIETECAERSICPDLIIAIAETESRLNPKAVSSSGCVGLCQISPKWHKKRMEELGVDDLLDPYQNVLVCIDYISDLFDDYGEIYEVLMIYNMGSSAVERFNAGKISSYALEVSARSEELERIRERKKSEEEYRRNHFQGVLRLDELQSTRRKMVLDHLYDIGESERFSFEKDSICDW